MYLLDSVIVIDHCNGIDAATGFIEQHADELAISAITRAEVMAGFTEETVALGAALLDTFEFLPIDADIADAAARLRRNTPLRLPDALQAACAICRKLTLVTRNTRDFPPGRFDFVSVPCRVGG